MWLAIATKYTLACKEVLKSAKSVIKGGSTWGKHVKWSDQTAIPSSPAYYNTFMHYSRGLHNVRSSLPLRLFTEEDLWVVDLEHSVTKTYKYSLGNCGEFAKLAFYQFIQRGVPAEVMYLQNGDHAFVIVGRKIGSDINDKSTWGSDAMVCDPWDGHFYNTYKMHEYFEKNILKGYKLGCTNHNTDYILKYRTNEKLKNHFAKECKLINSSLNKYTNDLKRLMRFTPPGKHSFIINKIAQLDKIKIAVSNPNEVFVETWESNKPDDKKKDVPQLDQYSRTRNDLLDYVSYIDNLINSTIQKDYKKIYTNRYGIFSKIGSLLGIYTAQENILLNIQNDLENFNHHCKKKGLIF